MSASIFDLLNRFDGRLSEYSASTVLFRKGDPVEHLFLVLDGEVRLARFLENGDQIVLQRAGPNSVLAEASLFSQYYHCDAICHQDAQVKPIRKYDVESHLAHNNQMAVSMAAHLAREVQATRLRAEVLRLRTVAERLDAWMAWHDDELPEKGNWRVIALEIGVSPEALYRELARRR
ncbi:MAG: Crp/Fnr family transcriptional regulator [Thalassospira sp.]|uniref:Crp/Fnr family transcriptional regulator n=1 Tax=Thalassospira sp. TaxID=1912094 RepID=UPI0032ECEFC5